MPKILFEDEYFIAASKPSGLLTHPSDECRQVKESLLFELRDHCDTRLYPVNRLDRPVSGINIFSKSPVGVTRMQTVWPDASKQYIALARGTIEKDGTHDFDLNNDNKVPQIAITHYKVIENFKDSCLLQVSIETGRRHQIRRHFSRRMQALLGDRKYGKKKWNDNYLENYGLERIFLHSTRLEFTHPYTQDKIIIEDPISRDLQLTLDMLRKDHEK